MMFRMCGSVLAAVLLLAALVNAESWQQFSDPVEAGFDPERLELVDSIIAANGVAACLIVRDGRIVRGWGDTRRRFPMASIRKSLAHSVIGLHVATGEINLAAILEELHIDDRDGLSEQERRATVADLMKARSGIYHAAAFSPRGMQAGLPERDSYRPGEHWEYNNWDFNALSTVFEQRTGRSLFEAFEAEIARPLGMEDFNLSHTHYLHEPEVSLHPAYLFRMSARDLARFGLLYEAQGKWMNRPLVPDDWVERGLASHSPETNHFSFQTDYGMLWWRFTEPVAGQTVCFAHGGSGQVLVLVPELDLVIVHLIDEYRMQAVSDTRQYHLIEAAIKACTEAVDSEAATEAYEPPATFSADTVSQDRPAAAAVPGHYRHPMLGDIYLYRLNQELILGTKLGRFPLVALDDSTVISPDMQVPVRLTRVESAGDKQTAEVRMDAARHIEQITLKY